MAAKQIFSVCVWVWACRPKSSRLYLFSEKKKKKSVAFLMFAAPVHR